MKSKSKIIIVALSFLVLFSLFSLISFAQRSESAITLSQTSADIGKGEEIDVYSFIMEEDKAENTYTYSSSDSDIAAVSESGIVKGNKIGTATITVTLHTFETQEVFNEQTGTSEKKTTEKTYNAALEVNVKTAAAKLKLNYHKIALGIDDTFTLKATITGTSFLNDFSSSDEEVAEVDSNGVIKALKEGNAIITCKTFNDITDCCVIKVTKNASKLVITTANIKIQKGSNVHRIAYKFSSGGISGSVIFGSTNNKIFTVNQKGFITAIKKGKATVTLKTAYENVYAKQILTVIDNALILNCNAAQLALDRSNISRLVYGKSVQGRPLEAYVITNLKTGKYKKTLFMDFAVHGFEDRYAKDGKRLTAEANRIIIYYANHSEELGIYRLVIIPCANPDGTIAGKNNLRACKSAFGRCTAKHIDINRDFGPFRAIESIKLKNFIVKCKPNIYLNMHGWLNETIGTKKLALIINKAQGLPDYIASYGTPSHYIISWVRYNLKIPAVLVEYKAPNRISLTKNVLMIKNIIKAY